MLAGGRVGWFAATTKIQVDAWREIKQLLGPAVTHISEQELRLELINGGVLEMWSLGSEGAGRGRKYHRVIVDEAAYARTLESDWNRAIRPTLADYQGDAWFLSSPQGRTFFWTLWQRGQDPSYPDWMSWRLPTSTNPYIAATEIDAARRDMPERAFQQEMLAEFLEFDGTVFRRLTEATRATLQDARVAILDDDGNTRGHHQYAFGVDWGKLSDFTVITVIDLTTREVVTIDRFQQIDYVVQVGRLKALAERFQPGTVIVEQNSIGVPLIEQLWREDLPVQPFVTSNATKAVAIDALALAFERGELAIPADPVLLGELAAFEATKLPSGLLRYSAPDGFHDDCVMSLALAFQALAGAGLPYSGEGWDALLEQEDY